VVSFDREWRYVFMNRQAELNHQRPASDFLGRVVWEMFPEGKELESYRRYHEAIARQEESAFEEYVPMIGRWFEQRLFPSSDGLTVIARDVTDWRAIRLERTKLASALAEIQSGGAATPEAVAGDVVSGASPAAIDATPNPLRTFTTFFPHPGARDALVAYFRESNAFLAAVRDTGAFSVEIQAADDPRGPVVITALWRSGADYARWERHPARAEILAALHAHVEEMCVEKYEVVRRATPSEDISAP